MCGRTAVPVRRAVFSSSSMSAGEGHSASFFLSPRLASCPLSRARIIRSYRIVSVPWKRCGEGVVALGDTPRLVGGVILASRPSSRPLVSLCGSFDFPRIGWRADVVRRFCQLISCDIPWLRRRGGSFSLTHFARLHSSRLSSRLPVSCGRLVSILCGSLIYPFHLVDLSASRRSVLRLVFSSRSAVRLLRLVLSVSSSSPYSLVSLGGSSRRLVGRGVLSRSPVSFSSVLVSSRSLRLIDMMMSGGSSCPCLVAACLFPVAPSWNPIGR